jgi:hypothetical protein
VLYASTSPCICRWPHIELRPPKVRYHARITAPSLGRIRAHSFTHSAYALAQGMRIRSNSRMSFRPHITARLSREIAYPPGYPGERFQDRWRLPKCQRHRHLSFFSYARVTELASVTVILHTSYIYSNLDAFRWTICTARYFFNI